MSAVARIKLVAAVVAVAVVGVVVAGELSAGDQYRVLVPLDDAAGLRDGSAVVQGGVRIGSVKLRIDRRDQVSAELRIDRGRAPVSRDAQIAISSLNLLGTKQIEVDAGTPNTPAPDGYRYPRGRASVAVDLDQVLDVLDAPTRAGLTILINEAGQAITGRSEDLSDMLAQLPRSLDKGTALLREVDAQNGALSRLLTHSDRAVASIAAERRALGRSLAAVAGTATTIAQRRRALSDTLHEAPETLQTLQRVLYDLRDTTVPLEPAARNIRASAAPLTAVLEQLEPVRRAADPTLRQAVRTAPSLTQLGRRAQPVISKAVPVLEQLAAASDAVQPVTKTVQMSFANLISTADNWSKAIQFRDGMSRVFRGEATLSPDAIEKLLMLLDEQVAAKRNPKPQPGKTTRQPSTTPAPTPVPSQPAKPVVPKLPEVRFPAAPGAPEVTDGVNDLLDYLLGE